MSCIAANGDKWVISEDSDGNWRWTCFPKDGEPKSVGGFGSEGECKVDAERNGMDCKPEPIPGPED